MTDSKSPQPAAVKPTLRQMLKVAITPRMIGFAIVIIAAAIVCVKLGTWQLDRALSKAEQTQAAEMAARSGAPAEPIEAIVAPQTRFVQDMVGQRVEVVGTFEGPEFFVPGKFRPNPTDPKDKDLWTYGYWVISPLRTDAGAVMTVVRGWVETANPVYLNADGLDATVVGALDGADPAGAAVDGFTIGAVSTGQLANVWEGPLYSGYVIATSIDDGPLVPNGLPGLDAAPTPVVEGGGLNLRNLAYAGEWFIFGGFAIAIWLRMVRDEATDLANDAVVAAA